VNGAHIANSRRTSATLSAVHRVAAKRPGEWRHKALLDVTILFRVKRVDPSPSHRFAAGPALSHKGRGKLEGRTAGCPRFLRITKKAAQGRPFAFERLFGDQPNFVIF
jgi:hypothetical protein